MSNWTTPRKPKACPKSMNHLKKIVDSILTFKLTCINLSPSWVLMRAVRDSRQFMSHSVVLPEYNCTIIIP